MVGNKIEVRPGSRRIVRARLGIGATGDPRAICNEMRGAGSWGPTGDARRREAADIYRHDNMGRAYGRVYQRDERVSGTRSVRGRD
jgi:hypothetical protein